MNKVIAFLETFKVQLIALLESIFGKLPADDSNPGPPKNAVKIGSVPQFGDNGDDVKALQRALGVDDDGDFGKQTKSAVSAVQKKNGLAGSGILGPKTLKLLNLEVVVKAPSTGEVTITKDLQGKQGRHLYPSMRVLMEERAFPLGKVPDMFPNKELAKVVVYLAKVMLSLDVIESGGNNKGEKVGFIQAIVGAFKKGGNGDAWCMSMVQCIIAFIEDYYGVESPVMASEHCMTVIGAAKKIEGLVSMKCEVGTAYVGRHGTSQQGHTGIVTEDISSVSMETIDGNTGSNISDGDGLFKKIRNKSKNGDLVTQGFVRVYPYNKIPA